MADKPTTPPPAYFLSLSLENVRSFGAKQTISFATKEGRPAQWTIILGDNGVGKTTVLKALASAVPLGEFDNTLEYPQVFKNNLLLFKWQAQRSTTKKRAEIIAKICTDNLLSNNRYDIAAKQTGSIHLEIIENVSKHPALGVTIPLINLTGLLCYGYGASRSTGNSTLSETPETVDTCASLFDDRADLLNPEEWFLNIDYGIRLLAEDKRKQLSDANDRVRQMLKDVLPGVTDLRIENNGTPQKPQISLQFLLYGTWVRLRDMSLGYQTLIVWLTDLASKLFVRYPESDNPLAEPAIVLIDEIDLHLHPQWQRELLGMLSKIFVNTQFIATAHSPLVVQAATDADSNVVLLRREGDQTIVSQNPVDVRGWRVDQILTSTFFNLETARSLETEKKLDRQATLLNKEKLTAKQRQKLDDLTLELEGQPMGSVGAEEEEEAMLRELTRRAGKRPKA